MISKAQLSILIMAHLIRQLKEKTLDLMVILIKIVLPRSAQTNKFKVEVSIMTIQIMVRS